MTEEQMRDLVRECGLDWHKGYMPLFDGDPTKRFAVLYAALESALREALAQPAAEPHKIAYMCGIDWQHHVGHDTKAVPIYSTAKGVFVHGPECGVVRVRIIEDGWEVEQRMETP